MLVGVEVSQAFYKGDGTVTKGWEKEAQITQI